MAENLPKGLDYDVATEQKSRADMTEMEQLREFVGGVCEVVKTFVSDEVRRVVYGTEHNRS